MRAAGRVGVESATRPDANRKEIEKLRIVTVGVTVRRAVSASASLALAGGDSVPLRQSVERAPMDAEELSGELLVPPRLFQDPAQMASDHLVEAQRRRGPCG